MPTKRPRAIRAQRRPAQLGGHGRGHRLGYRWGSCGSRGALNFHWKTILLPPRIIDYILVHELVHIHEPHHTPAFWTRVERVLPDYAARKEWLAGNGQTETSW